MPMGASRRLPRNKPKFRAQGRNRGSRFLRASRLVFIAITLTILAFLRHFLHAQHRAPPPVLSRRDALLADLAHRPERLAHAKAPLSGLVLFHGETASLKYALKSWIDFGLIDELSHILFFVNGRSPSYNLPLVLRELFDKLPKGRWSVEYSKENLPIGLALCRMIDLAPTDIVLFLEKDWALIEPPDITHSRIIDGKALLATGNANVVRYRHRESPGVPLHALIMHQGREESILRIQKNLLCFVHHWQTDPPNSYPAQDHMWRCGKGIPGIDLDEYDIFCAPSKYCQWTNNPSMFKKSWFVPQVADVFRREHQIELEKEGSDSPFLDFEYYTNWRSFAWSDQNFSVAVNGGLFSHAEQKEQAYFNTLWYAHYRLTVDFEEIRNIYLQNETRFKVRGGIHRDPHGFLQDSMMERYPVQFVQKYHWKETFTGTLKIQRDMIQTQYQKFLNNYRELSVEAWDKNNGSSSKTSKAFDLSHELVKMKSSIEKAMMLVPPLMPHQMTITLVTCVLDLNRDQLGKDGFQFNRDFNMYLDAMETWLKHSYPKIVYTTKDVMEKLLETMSEEAKNTTHFMVMAREDLRSKWMGPDLYDKVQEIRQSREWLTRAGWLKNSPQAGLKDYNPLVMSKMFMMRDAARQNPFHTSHFVFLDAKHSCMRPNEMNSKNDHILRAHMFDKLLMTHFDYTPSTEVHGFEHKAFYRVLGVSETDKAQLVKVGRGGIFGGSAFVLEYMTALYDMALTATLHEGLMGTEENIFSILLYRVPDYVDPFNNNWACPENVEKDHSCPDLKDQGYNCAIFDWVARDAVDGS